MIRRLVPPVVSLFIALFGSVHSSSSWANEGKVIVDEAGVAGETITITIRYTDNTSETVTFTPAANDVVDATKKAALIAAKITEQAVNAEATASGGTATVKSKGGKTLSKIPITPGKSKEKDRVNPSSLASLGFPNLQFAVELVGISTGNFLATLDIGGPGGNVFSLNTDGLDVATILTAFESQIDPFFPSFVEDNSLIVTGVTESNDFLAFFDDPGFLATHSMAAVTPEPPALFVVLGGIVSLVWLGRRQTRDDRC